MIDVVLPCLNEAGARRLGRLVGVRVRDLGPMRAARDMSRVPA